MLRHCVERSGCLSERFPVIPCLVQARGLGGYVSEDCRLLEVAIRPDVEAFPFLKSVPGVFVTRASYANSSGANVRRSRSAKCSFRKTAFTLADAARPNSLAS